MCEAHCIQARHPVSFPLEFPNRHTANVDRVVLMQCAVDAACQKLFLARTRWTKCTRAYPQCISLKSQSKDRYAYHESWTCVHIKCT